MQPADFGHLFANHGSDKTWHKYHLLYPNLIQGRTIKRFLELGLYLRGDDRTELHAWAQIFPDAEIIGADILYHPTTDTDRITTHGFDQRDPKSIALLAQAIGPNIDFIVDDASHLTELTINTIRGLHHLVTPGGLYVIEDVRYETFKALDCHTVEELGPVIDDLGYRWEIITGKPDEGTAHNSFLIVVYC